MGERENNGRAGNQPMNEQKWRENLVGLYKPHGTDAHESYGRGPWRARVIGGAFLLRPKVAGIGTDFYFG
jgi:hypothetical protein